MRAVAPLTAVDSLRSAASPTFTVPSFTMARWTVRSVKGLLVDFLDRYNIEIHQPKEVDILCPMCGTKTTGKVEEEKK